MQLKRVPAVVTYLTAVLCGLVGAAFWLQHLFGVPTVTGLSNALLFSGLTATLTGMGYVFGLGANRW